MMRILYFSNSYTSHDHRFLSKLSEWSKDVWFLCLTQLDGLAYNCLPQGVQYIQWPEKSTVASNQIESYLSYMPQFESIISKIQPDLIHAGPIQSCAFMTALAGFQPFVAVSWGSDMLIDAKQNLAWGWMTQYTLDHSHAFLCDCQTVQDDAIQLYHYDEENIVQFPWGIDLSIFRKVGNQIDLRSRLGWQNTKILLSTRSWENIYAIDVLLESFKLAISENNQLRLVLLGSGSLMKFVETYLSDHQLHDYVYCPGRIEYQYLPDYFRSADIYISCSRSDGASISLIEAMATCLPVIVTDIPSNREWVKIGENGWLGEIDNSRSFANAIISAANLSMDDYEKIGAYNRQVAESRADWDKNALLLKQAYHKILKDDGSYCYS